MILSFLSLQVVASKEPSLFMDMLKITSGWQSMAWVTEPWLMFHTII